MKRIDTNISFVNMADMFAGDVRRYKDDVVFARQLIPVRNFPDFFQIPAPTIVLLESGHTVGRLNLQPKTVDGPCLVVIMPHQTLEIHERFNDYSGRFLILSEDLCQRLNLQKQHVLIHSILRNPVVPLRPEEVRQVRHYFDSLALMLRDVDHPYLSEMVLHMVQTMFFALGKFFCKPGEKLEWTRNELITERFLSLVQNHCHEHRTLQFYAEKMMLSPHYLNNAIKKGTGDSASSWIIQYTVLEAKTLLATTNMPVGKICEFLHFGDASTFGKFFRRNTGMTTSQFRRKERFVRGDNESVETEEE